MSNAAQRVARVLAGESLQPPPVAPLVAADHAAELLGWRVGEVVQSAELLSEALLQAHDRYRGDFLIVFADVNVEAEAMGCRLNFPDHAPPFVIQTCAPQELRSADPQRDGRLPILLAAAREINDRIGAEVKVFASIKDPFSAAALASGPEEFYTWLLQEPELAQRAIKIALGNQKRYLAALIATGAGIVIGAPLASGSILGAEHFRNFAAEPMRQLLRLAHGYRATCGVHLCGDANPVLDQLIALDADFLSLETFDVQRWRNLTSQQPHPPALMGYLPTGLLLQGTAAEIASEVAAECHVLAGLPHLLATACDVPQLTPAEQVIQFIRAGRGEF